MNDKEHGFFAILLVVLSMASHDAHPSCLPKSITPPATKHIQHRKDNITILIFLTRLPATSQTLNIQNQLSSLRSLFLVEAKFLLIDYFCTSSGDCASGGHNFCVSFCTLVYYSVYDHPASTIVFTLIDSYFQQKPDFCSTLMLFLVEVR